MKVLPLRDVFGYFSVSNSKLWSESASKLGRNERHSSPWKSLIRKSSPAKLMEDKWEGLQGEFDSAELGSHSVVADWYTTSPHWALCNKLMQMLNITPWISPSLSLFVTLDISDLLVQLMTLLNVTIYTSKACWIWWSESIKAGLNSASLLTSSGELIGVETVLARDECSSGIFEALLQHPSKVKPSIGEGPLLALDSRSLVFRPLSFLLTTRHKAKPPYRWIDSRGKIRQLINLQFINNLICIVSLGLEEINVIPRS